MALAYHQPSSPPYPATVAKIAQLTQLEPGWNGHRAARISPAAQMGAIDFLAKVWAEFGTSVPEPTVVVPTPDGGVALEWIVKDDHRVMGVEIVFLDRGNEYSVRDRDGQRLDDEGENVAASVLLYEVIKPRVAGRFVLAK